MKAIYLDSNYKCHTINDGTMTFIETDFFDGKCDEFIEGYRFIPFNKSWTNFNGSIFYGEMISPWKPYHELEAVQREYESQKLSQYETEITELKNIQIDLNTSYQEGINSI